MDKLLDYSKLLKTADEFDIQQIRSKYREDNEKSFDSQYNEFAEENSGVDFNTEGIDYQLALQAIDQNEGSEQNYHSNFIKIDDELESEQENVREVDTELSEKSKPQEVHQLKPINNSKAPSAPPIAKDILLKAKNKIDSKNEEQKKIPCPPPITMTLLK